MTAKKSNRVLNFGGYRLLTLCSETLAVAKDLLDQGEIDGFHISKFHGSGQEELNRFAGLQGVVGLALQEQASVDYAPLRGSGLRHLELVETPAWPRFEELPCLQGFAADAKGNDPAQLPVGLRALVLQRFQGKSLQGISHLGSLVQLDLSQPGKLESLIGLPESVEGLGIGNAPRLVDISALGKCRLRRLAFDVCRKVEGLEVIGQHHALERLMLAKLGEIPTLSFLSQCPKLKFLSFPGTRIADGDLSVCEGIDYVYFEPHEHYSHTLADLQPKR